ncbi:acyltransferase family protein [Methylophilus flavus]|uniref:Acyltransferase family protein n=1 Tax=Methylophilus flavus TaxID=640084 RepID=A0ABW3PB21_9PROT
MQSNAYYRPEIDGLRAIAVMLVVLFHAFPTRIAGGFIGVDIFFVISGYLISNIILNEISKGNFTILGFYKKRINRIYPALAFVLLTCVLVSKFLLFKAEIAEFDLSVFFSTIFSANLYFLKTLNYFDNSAENHPLLHLWSLGVEEQFYIFWPFLLLYAAKKTNSFAIKAITLVLAVSFLLNILFVAQYQSNVFYLPFTRFWELGFGSLCALVTRTNIHKYPIKIFNCKVNSDFLTMLGLLFIIVCELLIQPTSLFPGWFAVLPVLGSGLILTYGESSNFAKKILANRLFVFVGLISYPLYLWHWPILSFSHIYLGYLMVGYVKVFLVFLSFLFAIVTYYLIEIPLRYKITHNLKPLFLFILLLLIGFYSLVSYQNISSSKLTEYDEFVSFYKGYVGNTDYVNKNRVYCSYIDQNGSFEENIPSSCIIKDAKNLIVLWGDSHAYQLFSGLEKNLDSKFSLSQLTSSGCHPSIKLQGSSNSINCNKANEKALDVIRASKPGIVVLAQRDSHDSTDWNSLAVELKNLGVKRVILLGPVPQWNQYLYRFLAKNYTTLNDIPPYIGGKVLNQAILELDISLKKKYSQSTALEYISLVDLFCEPKLGCLSFVKDSSVELTTFDYGHLGLSASEMVAKKITQSIDKK